MRHGLDRCRDRCVLLVEDNYLVGMSMKRALEAMGLRVVGPFGSCAEALAKIGDSRVDLGVLDINVSDGTSEPIALALKECGVPYFFVTGYSSPGLTREACGETMLLHKPVATDALEQAVEEAIGTPVTA